MNGVQNLQQFVDDLNNNPEIYGILKQYGIY